MVARASKNRPDPESPNLNVKVELDNKALRVKNNSLTQTVAKLQKDNAELAKEVTSLRGENLEMNSKYNNLKNVMSIIDSTAKTCLPKLNEVVETFTGIIQLCSVAANITNFFHTLNDSTKKDARTQAVKPQIVNGHILHNPTITLSRLSNDNSPNTFQRTKRFSNDIPSTSRGLTELTIDINRLANRTQEQNDNIDNRDNEDDSEGEDFFLQSSVKESRRTQSVNNMDGIRRHEEDFEDSDDEENEEEEEDSDKYSDQRLTPIHEGEEENQLLDAASPRAKQLPFLQGRLQEVRISLNQLPNAYIEQFLSSGNISISVSPPDRRASFKHDMVDERRRRYVETQAKEEASFSDDSRLNQVSVRFKSPGMMRSRDSFEGTGTTGSRTSSMMPEYSESMSAIQGFQTPSTITPSNSNSLHSDTLQDLDMLHIELQHRTSTPIVPRMSGGSEAGHSNQYDTLDRSKNDKLMFNSNVTKRKAASRGKKKVAQVLLNRLSVEKRLSGSPIKTIESIVNLPVIRKSSEFKKRKKTKVNDSKAMSSDEENVDKEAKNNKKAKRRKKDSPTKKTNDVLKSKLKTSPSKSPPGRPKRAARPKNMREPNLHKKMRRSK